MGVAPKAKTSDTAAQGYEVTAVLCGVDDGQAAKNGGKFNQGSAIKVCISPDIQAINDGVIMGSVDEFNWARGATVQPAIDTESLVKNTPAKDGLSLIDDADKQKIIVTTVLYAAFYATTGEVAASGAATMQFPSGGDASGDASRDAGDGSRSRLLDSNKRNLQEDDGGDAIAPFDVTATVNKADDGPASLQETQTAGGTVTSIISIATPIVGLIISTILLV